jgi:enoyl-CoA hydratase/carnithine racemase
MTPARTAYTDLDEYRDRYPSVSMTRSDGVLEVRFHTDGGPFLWSVESMSDLAGAFAAIARDPENQIVIMTGTGDIFSGPIASRDSFPYSAPSRWDELTRIATLLITSLLEIDAITVSCINGPAFRHAEIPLLADIVLAAPETTFQDSAHYVNRTTPGDFLGLLFPLLIGLNRARYFLLTGRSIDAEEALALGLVNELHPRERLLPRAHQLAASLRRQNPLVLRYTRRLLTHQLKRLALDVGYGMALEGMGVVDESLRDDRLAPDGT